MSAVEYAVIVALISAVLLTVVTTIGGDVKDQFCSVANGMAGSMVCGGTDGDGGEVNEPPIPAGCDANDNYVGETLWMKVDYDGTPEWEFYPAGASQAMQDMFAAWDDEILVLDAPSREADGLAQYGIADYAGILRGCAPGSGGNYYGGKVTYGGLPTGGRNTVGQVPYHLVVDGYLPSGEPVWRLEKEGPCETGDGWDGFFDPNRGCADALGYDGILLPDTGYTDAGGRVTCGDETGSAVTKVVGGALQDYSGAGWCNSHHGVQQVRNAAKVLGGAGFTGRALVRESTYTRTKPIHLRPVHA